MGYIAETEHGMSPGKLGNTKETKQEAGFGVGGALRGRVTRGELGSGD